MLCLDGSFDQLAFMFLNKQEFCLTSLNCRVSLLSTIPTVELNVIVFTRYDYNTHTVTSDVAGGRWYETNNVENYLPFLYAKIGKPERVVIFRCDTDIFSSRKKHKNRNTVKDHKHYLAAKDYYTSYHKNKTIAKRKAKVSSLQFKIKKQL